MDLASEPRPGRHHWQTWRSRQLWIPWLLYAVGLALCFSPTLFSGFARAQNDLGDTRYNTYILEHGYRWLRGIPPHQRFWDAPIFYPARNASALSDILLGVAPFYWVWRMLGFEPDTSMSLFQMGVLTANFWVCRAWLSSVFGLASLGSAAGAFLFAFSNARWVRLGHVQLLGQFWSILAFWAVARFLDPALPAARRRAWLAAFFASVVAQLYAGFYLGWFLGLALGACGLACLGSEASRARILGALRRFPVELGALGLAAAALLAPMGSHYLESARSVGLRPISDVMYPALQSWFYLGPASWLYGWFRYFKMFRSLPFHLEQSLGWGLFTLYAAVQGYRSLRGRSPYAGPVLAGAAAIFVATTVFPPRLVLWPWVFPYLPGAGAIRALQRVGLLALIPGAAALGAWFDRRPLARGTWLLLGFFLLEQGHRSPYSFDKAQKRADVAQVAAKVKPEACDAFVVDWRAGRDELSLPYPDYKYELDAMEASLALGIPTLNGMSGSAPPGYGFGGDFAAKLKAWRERQGIQAARICQVRLDSTEGTAAPPSGEAAPPGAREPAPGR